MKKKNSEVFYSIFNIRKMKKKSLRAILCFSLWKKAPDLLTIRRERLANTQENKRLMGIYPKIGIDWINVQGLVEI